MPTSRIMDFIGNNFPSLVYLWKMRKERFRRSAPIAETFTEIYHHNRWGDAESRSGAASNLSNTRAVREALRGLIKSVGARSMLDIPCGDFNWMKEVPLDLNRYIGADIVQALTDSNRRFEDDTRAFVTLDITSDTLPTVDSDTCRDCLIQELLQMGAAIRSTEAVFRTHLRMRIKRLVRRTICFSKTERMHDLVIGFFINRYEFGRLL